MLTFQEPYRELIFTLSVFVKVLPYVCKLDIET